MRDANFHMKIRASQSLDAKAWSAGIGPVASTMPIAHDSGALRGKRAIGGGRRWLQHVLFQPALVASHQNPKLSVFGDRRDAAGKPRNFVVTAIAHKLVSIANALCKSRRKGTNQTA